MDAIHELMGGTGQVGGNEARQHVNKVSSKVTLTFDISKSKGLSEQEKNLLCKNLASRLTKSGHIQLSADESRSQFRNKALVTERLVNLITRNIIRPKVRKASKPTKGSKIRKEKAKIKQSQKKDLRKKPKL